MATPTDFNPQAPEPRDRQIALVALLMDDAVAAAERSAAETELSLAPEGRRLLDAWRSLSSPPPAPPAPDLVDSIMRQLPAQPSRPAQPAPRTGFADMLREFGRVLNRPRLRYALAFLGVLAISLIVATGLPMIAPGEASGAAVGEAQRGGLVLAGAGLAVAIAALWLWHRRS